MTTTTDAPVHPAGTSNNWDQLHRFVFDDLAVRGTLVRLDRSLQRNLSAHAYPAPVAGLLAEATTAIALLATTVKLKGRLALQLQGSGPVKLLLAESASDPAQPGPGIRSLAQWRPSPAFEADSTAAPGFSDLVQGGQLALSLLPDQGQQYQGVVPLDGGSIAGCLEHYFQQSEQLATRVMIWHERSGNDSRSVGLLIQALPGLDQQEDFNRIRLLAETLKSEEAFHLPIETLLHRLYHEENVRLFESQPVRFQCRCSRERCADTLRTLEQQDIIELLQEDGAVTVTCDFCNQIYRFDAIDVAALGHQIPGSAQSH
ncbi:Hsp33 family molecular chaperone HslO [Permianibacter sp. IMCC34836]|uniref:Hsp33 family molecular chaperone HslO n=1 Tax=Permianibacter fluminis TaxID=2738515 RepID=UPI0015567616|nr:Hsp33 family molecular chaperone HslO [Permianibacter fluminis]NQD35658.1 Hsp33 family molecular chaperone HslO [Permianibacter fluminis]